MSLRSFSTVYRNPEGIRNLLTKDFIVSKWRQVQKDTKPLFFTRDQQLVEYYVDFVGNNVNFKYFKPIYHIRMFLL